MKILMFISFVIPIFLFSAHGTEASCAPGKYNNSVSCITCEAGYACPGGTASRSACVAGYRCPTGTIVPQLCPTGWYQTSGTQSSCTECTAGNKCPSVTASPTPCPAGTYQPSSGMTNCLSCPPGMYKTGTGNTACDNCPAGKRCPNPAATPTDCTAGTFSVLGQSDCRSCPQGSYSTSPFTACTACPAGKKCYSGSGYISPTNCAAGTYSPLGELTCKTCLPGTYSGSGAASCTICPAGKQCANSAISPVGCSAGQFAPTGSSTCQPCPAGYQCPANSAQPVPCFAGYYALSNAGSCTACVAGKFCPAQNQAPQPCPTGTYSAAQATSCTPCPAGSQCPSGIKSNCATTGTYSLLSGGACQDCPNGHKCPTNNQAPIPCATGETTLGNTKQTSCTQCPAGKFCTTPQSTPTACTSGYYSTAGSTACTRCPAGFKCPSANAAPQACPSGTYSTGGTTNCLSCPAGSACPSPTSADTMITCAAGSYAVAGQSKCTVCPAGKACPSTNVATQNNCPTGHYSRGGLATCIACEAGFKCPAKDGSDRAPCLPGTYSTGSATTCTDCVAGNFCPNSDSNSQTPCPSGTFAAAKAAACTPCPAGKSCTTSAIGSDCSDGQFSPEGSSVCTSCPAGYRCPNKFTETKIPCELGYFSTGSATACTICPAGKACPLTNQTGTDCTAGYYSKVGQSVCTACPTGFYCASTSALPVKCPIGKYSLTKKQACSDCDAGYYCSGGATSSNPPEDLCPWGYYCTGGANKTPCPKGKYGSKKGATASTDCTQCPQGYYCPEATGGVPGDPLKCPAGHFCPQGTGDYKQSPCVAGKYNPNPGAVQASECKACVAGNYCPSGSTRTDTKCPAGHYCPAGAGSPTKCPVGTYTTEEGAVSADFCKGCPAGHYCAIGTATPTPCPAGTFNRLVSQSTISSCGSCTAGKACTKAGLPIPDSDCMPGYYCPGGNILPNQTEYACPAGTFTDFQNLTQASQCSACPPSQACLTGTGGVQKSPVPCAAGHYCPQGTGSPTQFPCPAGSWTDLTNLKASTECYACTKGSYCLEGSTALSGTCPKGYVCPPSTAYSTQHPCKAGTYNNKTGITHWDNCLDCTEGHYCPEGSILPTACKAGFYFSNTKGTAISSCLSCSAGSYCPTTATVTPLPCGKGKYSDTQASVCTDCDPGYYCDQNTTSKAFMLSERFCPAGLECPGNMTAMPNLQDNPCRAGYYCPKGSVNPFPIPCPNGTYNAKLGLQQVSQCQKCPPGYYCSTPGGSSPTGECPGGYYCPAGTADPHSFPCPIGTYRNGSAKESYQDCAQCPSGYYCDERGLAIPKDCPRGYYCPEKTITPERCPMGYYGNNTNVRRSDECTPCPGGKYCSGRGQTEPTALCDAGFYCREKAFSSSPPEGLTGGLCPAGGYCPEGSAAPTACAVGMYAPNAGAKSSVDCVPCAPGYYCAGQNTNLNSKCKGGYFCTGGAKTPTQHTVAPGYYSEDGAFAQLPCPPGTYQPAQASSSCLNCSEGYFCNRTAMVAQETCPAGHYCGFRTINPIECPIGTYNPKTFQKYLSHCVQCTAGSACTQTGLTEPDKQCYGGYFCKLGSITDMPSNATYGGPCKKGHYCPKGTAEGSEKQCLNGTYSNIEGLVNASQCMPCLAGKYCAGTGLTEPSGNCSARYFCNTGSKTPAPLDDVQGNLCPKGSYCPEGSASGVNCSDGTFAGTTGHAVCLPCPAGKQCISGTNSVIDPTWCPKGSYCPTGTGRNAPRCPAGTFNKLTGAINASSCQYCLAGYNCFGEGATGWDSADPTGSSSSVARCSAGWFCQYGVNMAKPDNVSNTGVGYPCQPGYYCTEGTSAMAQCANGTFRNITGAAAQSDCFSCPRGQYCSQELNVLPTGPCQRGYHCSGGAFSPTPDGSTGAGGGLCPVAHYCPEGVADPTPCPAGTYNNATGQWQCVPCPAGYFCRVKTTSFVSFECPAGYYCPNGTTDQHEFPCPMGTFLNTTGAKSVSDCLPCSPGKYCASPGLTVPSGECEAGHFCVRGSPYASPTAYANYSASDGCLCPSNATGGICPRGFFCPKGSWEPQKCKEGFYCEGQGLTNNTASGMCIAGYYCAGGAYVKDPRDGVSGNVCPMGRYCPAGTGANPPSCPIGTFSNRTGNKLESDCTPCTAGFYCASAGLTKPSGPCVGGYYCPQGSNTSTAIVCTAGYQCPVGSATPTKCDSGTFQAQAGQSGCDPCPAGYYCNIGNMPITDFTAYPCPAGHYCPNGTQTSTSFPCPAGTYSTTTRLESADNCTKCDAGKFCTTPGRTSVQGSCSARYWCISGASTPTPIDGATGKLCTEGHYCPSGTPSPVPCPAATWSNSTGLAASSDCLDCPGGYYCANTGLTAPEAKCSAGYYCQSRATTATPTDGTTGDKCTVHHYCPVGTASPLPCADGTYSPNTTASACVDCPAGLSCLSGTAPVPCTAGYYCPTGTGQVTLGCPPGTFSNSPGLKNASECTICTSGHYCANYNATAVTGPCDASYFCAAGATTKRPENATAQFGPCPAGSYCEAGTGTPQKCPQGTYGNVTHLAAAANCTPCDFGKYCGSQGLTSPSGPCSAGHYCLLGAQVPNNPTVDATGGPCPKGHYCPEGTSYPLPCLAGTYNNATGRANCSICPVGYYCPANTTEYAANSCPTGHYCPEGTRLATQFPCPAGTFNNVTGAGKASACLACTPGKHCSAQGLPAPSGPCAASYYCLSGAASARPNDLGNSSLASSCVCPANATGGLCPIGSYCPEGSAQPVSCTAGKFCQTAGLAAPTADCDPGFYCPPGQSESKPTNYTCPAGHYCIAGSASPQPCPPGTFFNATGARELAECLKCTAGSYCGSAGLAAPTGLCAAGYYCPAGQNSSSPAAFLCTPGHYCAAGSPQQVPCPTGQYQDLQGQAACKECPAGYYCDGTLRNDSNCDFGVQHPVPCRKGFFCPNGTGSATSHPCPAGTFGNATGLAAESQCSRCLPGWYCSGQNLTEPSGLCTAGHYCILGASTATPTDNVTGNICPRGHYCEAGVSAAVPCPAGSYGPTTGLTSQAACSACDPGRVCSRTGLIEPDDNCTAGYYCVARSTQANPAAGHCPVGSFCPPSSGSPQTCPPGYYTNTELNAACLLSPGGYYVANGSHPQLCPQGWFCPNGTGLVWQSCPSGTYGATPGLYELGQCTTCPGGSACDRANLSAPSGVCEGGHFCTSGSDTPRPSGSGHKGVAGPCPAGFYCPQNSTHAIPCPAGTYNNKTHASKFADCLSCPSGYYCDSTNLTAPNGLCSPGYYCTNGSVSGTPGIADSRGGPCVAGTYCPQGTPLPIDCAAGTFTDAGLRDNCTDCPPGYYCPNRAPNATICPRGAYCPPKTRSAFEYACGNGTFNNQTGQSNVSACQLCTPGHYCPLTGMAVPAGKCKPGWYCSLGSWSAEPAIVGNDTGLLGCQCPASSRGGPCMPGYYCPEGASRPLACDPGLYCANWTLASPMGPCSAGFYCNSTASTATPIDGNTGNYCPMGHYCPEGSNSSQPCALGYFLNRTHAFNVSECIPCTAGSYCPAAGLPKPAGLCQLGSYCPELSTARRPSGKQCYAGHRCPEGSAQMIPCESGEYQPLAEQGVCLMCPAGKYCDRTEAIAEKQSGTNATSHGVVTPKVCVMGHYCPNGTRTRNEFPCGPGTFNNATGAEQQADGCLPCTPGYYCGTSGLTNPSGQCLEGYYCTAGERYAAPNVTTSTGGPCPVGSYCPLASVAPIPCPRGTFGQHDRLAAAIDCTVCTPGHFCGSTGLTSTTGLCTAGFYCSNRSEEASPVSKPYGDICTTGAYCPQGSHQPLLCPLGTYQPLTQRIASSACLPCTGGYYCGSAGLANATGPCSAGYYCNGSASSATEVACPIGSECPAGSVLPTLCLSGTFTNISGQASCFKCPEGRYCSGGASAALCPTGRYCPAGTGADPPRCPAGTFNPVLGLVNISQCLPCTGGRYCASEGLSMPTGNCSAGFYCREGLNISNPVTGAPHTGSGDECPAGYECPEGSAEPRPCSPGTFAGSARQAACVQCPVRFYCANATVTPITCPVGHYCPAGTDAVDRFPCPAGSYRNTTGASAESDCRLCPAGYYCAGTANVGPDGPCADGYYCIGGALQERPLVSGNLTGNGTTADLLANTTCSPPWKCVCPSLVATRGGLCPAGKYCPSGSPFPKDCTLGYYCPRVGLSAPVGKCNAGYYCNDSATSATEKACPLGHYCPEGTGQPIPCPDSTFGNASRASALSDCQSCTPGKFCQGVGNVLPTGPCLARYYCPGGQNVSAPVDLTCLAGHYCPVGSPASLLCPNGTYTPDRGYSSCLKCPAGRYCDPSNGTAIVNPPVCPQGYYCPPGTGLYTATPCPAGTYGHSQGLQAIGNCTQCPGGLYCQGSGLTSPTGGCFAGYYCSGGASSPQPSGVGGNECYIGHYCPSNTTTPIPCPRGTYNSVKRINDSSQCQKCPPGSYCNSTGLSTSAGVPPCQAGYICTGGSTTPTPTNPAEGYICPIGYYCPEGATTPIGCPVGQYNSDLGQASCTICPAGKACPSRNMSTPETCPSGYYCPGGGTPPQACPAGTYNNETGASLVSSCTSCPPGEYCQGTGNNSPTGPCLAGYRCQGGATAAVPTPTGSFPLNGECPAGRYCPSGTAAPVLCPRGTFRSVTRGASVSDCQPCTGGYYCRDEGLTAVTGKCQRGYYCPTNETIDSATPSHRQCPKEHFCLEGSASPQPCPAGQSQASVGQWACTLCPAGYYCESSAAQLPCPAYNFCPAGSSKPTPCLNGTYTLDNATKLEKADDCLSCVTGSYCLAGKIQAPCAAGSFCYSGASNHTPEAPAPTTTGCPGSPPECAGPCPAGFWCAEGTKVPTPCKNETIRETPGGMSEADCLPCPPGNRCVEGDPVKKPCPVGHYCLRGTAPTPCPVLTFRSTTGAKTLTDCQACTAGYYCNVTGIADVTPYPCPSGHYCPTGSYPQTCPAGRMQPGVGAAAATNCPLCTPGYHCPSGRINVNGIACDPAYECPEGAAVQKFCRPGGFCKGTTGVPPLCWAGYYCPNATITPILCLFPYYCPEGSNMTLTCPLGYRANNKGGLRMNKIDSCIICPAGTYGNFSDRSKCLTCPPGYYCPEGTGHGDTYPCEYGRYCPAGSSAPTLCAAGTYNNKRLSYKASDCKNCPANYYTKAPGQRSCKNCGSSSSSAIGASSCTCRGKFRKFQSSGSCECLGGYVYYDEKNTKKYEGDGSEDCQPDVEERCNAKQVRDAATRRCVSTDAVDCTQRCSGSGSYSTSISRCECDKVESDLAICNAKCREDAPVATILVRSDGSVAAKIYDPVTKTTKVETLTDVLGPSETPAEGAYTIYTNCLPDGITGLLPTSSDIANLFQNLDSFAAPNRRRLLAVTINDPTPSISNPLICLQKGDIIVFRAYINPTNRSLSNYPVYVKQHMYNTNPAFDESAFQRLKYLIENTNVNVSRLVHVFNVPGVYVFANSQNSYKDMVVSVLAAGASCPTGHSRVMAASVENLNSLGVAKTGDLNQSPDWGLIIGMLAFLAACILLLVVAVIVWRPKYAGLQPLYRWRPLYRSLGKTAPVPEYLAHDEDAMLSAGLTTATTRGEADGSEVASHEGQLLEEFNVRVFYDKLEDQNLHLASQLAQQAEDMRRFYERLCNQNEELRRLLSDIDYDKLLSAQSAAAGGGAGGRDLNVNAATNEFRREGFSGRSAELMAALQLLLERLNSGRIPITTEMVERSIHGAKEGKNTVSVIDSAGGDLLTQHLKQRMALERELVNEEVDAVAKLNVNFDRQHAGVMLSQEEKLQRELAGKSPAEAEKILARHSQETAAQLTRIEADREKARKTLQEKLATRRRQKVEELRNRQAEECRAEGIPPAPDLGLEVQLAQTLAMEEQRVQAIADQEAAEGAMARDAGAKEEVLRVGAAFEEDLNALQNVASEAAAKDGDGEEEEEEEEEAAKRGAGALPRKRTRRSAKRKDEVARIMSDLRAQEARVAEGLAERQQHLQEELRKRQAKRREKVQQDLEKKHETAKSAPNPPPGLEAQLEAEAEASKAALDRLEAEERAELAAAHAANLRDDLDALFGDLLSAKGSLAKALGPEALEKLLEQHRRRQAALAEELEVARKRQETATAAKLQARRQRKQQDIDHRAQEVAAKAVLAEQQRQRNSGAPEVAPQAGDRTLVGLETSVTAAVPAAKESALAKELARRRAALQKRQEEQRAALAAQCDKEEADELRQLMAEADAERKRAENELRQRQAAELAARKASGEDAEALMALHTRQLAELMDRLDAQRQRHDLALRQRLAARRQKRLEDLRREQEAALRREELAGEAEVADLRQGALKEAENAAMARGVEENGVEDAPRVVTQVLAQRQAQEMAALEARMAKEREVMLTEAGVELAAKIARRREAAIARHRKELAALEGKKYSPEEKARLREALKEKQAAELEEMERRGAEEERLMRDAAERRWEARLANAKLDLRAGHYKEFAGAVRKFRPSDPSVAEAEKQAAELQQLRQELERQQRQEEAAMKEKLAAFEAQERERSAADLEKFKEQLEADSKREQQQLQQQLARLEERKSAIQAERQQQIAEKRRQMEAQGVAKDEQDRIIAQLNKEAEAAAAKMEAERLRMQAALQERIQRQREQKLVEKRSQVSVESAERQREFAERQEAALAGSVARMTQQVAEATGASTVGVKSSVVRTGSSGDASPAPPPAVVVVETPEEPPPSAAAMPATFDMARPLREEEFTALLMRSPLYRRVTHIRGRLDELANQDANDELADAREKSWEGEKEWRPAVISGLQPRHFLVYRFGLNVLATLRRHADHPEVSLLVAERMPPNRGWRRNAFRNSFTYDPYNRHLFVRLARMDQVGEFVLLLVHCSTHIKIGDMRDDTRPEFIREFNRGLSCVCDDLFFAKWRQEWRTGGPPKAPLRELFQKSDKGEDREEEKADLVGDLIDLRTLPSTDKKGIDFNKENILGRLKSYSKYEAMHGLAQQLGDVEDQLAAAQDQGSLRSAQQQLSTPGAAEEAAAEVPWSVSRSTMSGLSGHALRQAFENVFPQRGRPDGGDKAVTAAETARAKAAEQRQAQIDELDGQLARLSRQLLSKQGRAKGPTRGTEALEIRRQGIAGRIRELQRE